MPKARSTQPSRRYFKELRFRQFRAFCIVAQCLNFSEAAEALGISRPSIWQQVRSLEEELGTDLIRTRGKKLTLTADGELLLELILPVVESFDSVKSVFLDRRKALARRLSVATTSSLLVHELREPVRQYAKRHPDVHFHFVDRPSSEALPLLESDQADFAIIGLTEETIRPPALQFEPWLSYPFVLICPTDHPLAKKRQIELKHLCQYPLLLPLPATNGRQKINHTLAQAGLLKSIQPVLESSSAIVLARYVELGLGIAITSISPLLAKELRHGSPAFHLADLSATFGEDAVYIARRKGRHLLPHILEFQNLLLSIPQ